MNERIKELMPKPWTFPYPDREMYSKEQMEKFAELMVKECMNVIYNIDDLGGYHFKAANAVKEHFGVAE